MFWMYLGFIALVLVLLALDLGVFHRKASVISTKAALGWSAFWIAVGLSFVVFVYFGYEAHWLGLGLTPDFTSAGTVIDGVTVYNDGSSAAIKYLTGYVVEKSLAVDNIFVIAMIFASFKVPAIYQHRVLFWGIIGALIMRGAMIGAGALIVTKFAWVLYVFGVFLLLTGLKMAFTKDFEEDSDLSQKPIVKWMRKFIPMTDNYHGSHFFIRAGSAASHEAAHPGAAVKEDKAVDAAKPGTRMATPLFLALVLVEVTDLIFAVDSIPAIFTITSDAYLVFTSNVFALLGLRSLYFALAGMMDTFRYLKPALAAVLVVIGVKMLAHKPLAAWIGESFPIVMLVVVLGILAVGIIASLVADRRERQAA